MQPLLSKRKKSQPENFLLSIPPVARFAPRLFFHRRAAGKIRCIHRRATKGLTMQRKRVVIIEARDMCSPASVFQLPQTPRKPSRWRSREIRRRIGIIEKFNQLRAAGMSKAGAARELRKSYVTLWRWAKRIEPANAQSGARSILNKMAVPAAVLDRVQRLQAAGAGNATAWRAVATEPVCPPTLAKFLREARNIPPSLLSATRLEKLAALKGRGFIALQT
jgi:hypothetical protein